MFDGNKLPSDETSVSGNYRMSATAQTVELAEFPPAAIILECGCAFSPDGSWPFVCDTHTPQLGYHLRLAALQFKLQLLAGERPCAD